MQPSIPATPALVLTDENMAGDMFLLHSFIRKIFYFHQDINSHFLRPATAVL